MDSGIEEIIELCDSDKHETGVEKIALYGNVDSDECTHASRQLADGGT